MKHYLKQRISWLEFQARLAYVDAEEDTLEVRTSSRLNQTKTNTALTSSYWTTVPMRTLAQSDFSHSIHTPKSFEKLAKILSKETIRSTISLKTSLVFVNLLSKICSKRTSTSNLDIDHKFICLNLEKI